MPVDRRTLCPGIHAVGCADEGWAAEHLPGVCCLVLVGVPRGCAARSFLASPGLPAAALVVDVPSPSTLCAQDGVAATDAVTAVLAAARTVKTSTEDVYVVVGGPLRAELGEWSADAVLVAASVVSVSRKVLLDAAIRSMDPNFALDTAMVSQWSSLLNASRAFRFACSKCRRVLFGSEHLVEHERSTHQIRLRKSKKEASSADAGICTSLFVDASLVGSPAAAWMGDLADAEGKIACPECAHRLGTYCWQGSQCSCGSWVAPALQIVRRKVDMV